MQENFNGSNNGNNKNRNGKKRTSKVIKMPGVFKYKGQENLIDAMLDNVGTREELLFFLDDISNELKKYLEINELSEDLELQIYSLYHYLVRSGIENDTVEDRRKIYKNEKGKECFLIKCAESVLEQKRSEFVQGISQEMDDYEIKESNKLGQILLSINRNIYLQFELNGAIPLKMYINDNMRNFHYEDVKQDLNAMCRALVMSRGILFGIVEDEEENFCTAFGVAVAHNGEVQYLDSDDLNELIDELDVDLKDLEPDDLLYIIKKNNIGFTEDNQVSVPNKDENINDIDSKNSKSDKLEEIIHDEYEIYMEQMDDCENSEIEALSFQFKSNKNNKTRSKVISIDEIRNKANQT